MVLKINYLNTLREIIKSLENRKEQDIDKLEITLLPNETKYSMYWNENIKR